MSYKNPTPVAIALISVHGGLLAVQRAITPVGGWAFPGGYINQGEYAELAVQREVYEETGLSLDVHSFEPVITRCTPANQLLIFLRYHGPAVSLSEVLKSFKPNSEVSDLKIVTRVDELCFPIHTSILRTPELYS